MWSRLSGPPVSGINRHRQTLCDSDDHRLVVRMHFIIETAARDCRARPVTGVHARATTLTILPCVRGHWPARRRPFNGEARRTRRASLGLGLLLREQVWVPPYIIPPMSGGIPAPAGSFSGGSATTASVVRMFLAIDAAF
jgi:hypothetical protein